MSNLKDIIKDLDDVFIMDDDHKAVDSDSIISTGSYFLDFALGIGGIPRGRMTEIYGTEGAGKSTLCLHLVANAQEKFPDLNVLYIDTEHALNRSYAESLGVDMSKLAVSQPEYGEQAINIAEQLIRTSKFSLVIIDSATQLVPKYEYENDMEENKQQGALARLMGQTMRKLIPAVSKTNTSCVFVNQVRVVNMGLYAKTDATGGHALKFGASVRMRLKEKSGNLIVHNNKQIGKVIDIEIVKNKLSAPFKKATVELIFGKGFNKISELIDIAVTENIVEKRGNWFYYGGNNIGNGKMKTIEWLLDNPKIKSEITEQVEKIIYGE